MDTLDANILCTIGTSAMSTQPMRKQYPWFAASLFVDSVSGLLGETQVEGEQHPV